MPGSVISLIPKTNPNQLLYEELSWRQARHHVQKIKPELAKIIDAWNPPDDFTLIKVPYHFGADILTNGTLHFTNTEKRSVPITSPKFPSAIRDKLLYSPVPLGLILQNGCEVYLKDKDQISSLAFFKPGIILGLWESMGSDCGSFPSHVWNTIAGARSMYMLPQIADTSSHEKLKKRYGVRLHPPRKLYDHQRVFAEIAQSRHFHDEWTHEILLFTNKWQVPQPNNPHWNAFQNFLLKEAWDLSTYARNQFNQNLIWRQFMNCLQEQRVKPKWHHIEVLKQLIGIAVGAFPGFVPFTGETNTGPLLELQKAYSSNYGLDYTPTIMHPTYLDKTLPAIYFSIQLPTLFSQVDKNLKNTSLLSELRELKILWELFIDYSLEGKLAVKNTYLQDIVDNFKIEFFHPDDDSYGMIKKSQELCEIDSHSFCSSSGDTKFAASSQFLKGLIRISRIFE